MPDFVMTGSSAAPQFNPANLGKNKNGILTARNNTGGTVTLNITVGGVSSTNLFTSGKSTVSVPTGDQDVGTIGTVSGEYLLSPPGAANPTRGDIGNNVKVNVGLNDEDDAEADETDDVEEDPK